MVMDVSIIDAFTGFNHKMLWTILKSYGLRSNKVTVMRRCFKNRLQHYTDP